MRKLRLKRLLVVGVLVVSAAVATYSWTHAEETELIEYHKRLNRETLSGALSERSQLTRKTWPSWYGR